MRCLRTLTHASGAFAVRAGFLVIGHAVDKRAVDVPRARTDCQKSE